VTRCGADDRTKVLDPRDRCGAKAEVEEVARRQNKAGAATENRTMVMMLCCEVSERRKNILCRMGVHTFRKILETLRTKEVANAFAGRAGLDRGSKKNEKEGVCVDNFHETREEDDCKFDTVRIQ
jgi:hypothetical protein